MGGHDHVDRRVGVHGEPVLGRLTAELVVSGCSNLDTTPFDLEHATALETLAWGIWGRDVAVCSAAGPTRVLVADQVVLAAGAYERPVAFPGWSLPGVMSGDGARALLTQGVSPGQRVLVAGYGQWVQSAAARPGRLVVRAEGEATLRSVAGSEYVGPRTVRDAWLRSSAPGVVVAGDAGAIVGADYALLEGRLAGLAGALDAGRLSRAQAEPGARALQRRLHELQPDPDAPRAGLYGLADARTLICRCEDVSAGDIVERLFDDSVEPGPVIAESRAGMGSCQRRNCASLIAATISRHTGCHPDREHRPGHWSAAWCHWARWPNDHPNSSHWPT